MMTYVLNSSKVIASFFVTSIVYLFCTFYLDFFNQIWQKLLYLFSVISFQVLGKNACYKYFHFQHFYICSYMTLRICTLSCNCHHWPSTECSILKNWNSTHSAFLTPPIIKILVITILLCVSMNEMVWSTVYGWKHATFILCDWLVSLNMIFKFHPH
jgi:hypothetical protein